MAKKNFMAYGDAETIFTEYAGALNRKLNCFSGTREEFLALSVEERKKYEYILDPTSNVVVYAVMDEVDDVELTFTNDVATVSIPGITAKSKVWVFYSDASYDVAKAADITVTSGSGVVTFTAANTPTDTITCDILYYLKKDTTNFASVVGGGGHTIQDEGVDMAQEDALNFIDHDISDDSTNGATVVKPHRFSAEEMSEICHPLPDEPTLVGNVRMSLLWSNPSPSESFATQDVTLSSGDYDLLLTVFDILAPYGDMKSCITRKGDIIWLDGVDVATQKHTYGRYTSAQTDTVLTFTGGYYDGTASNKACIPVAIYGIKLL